MADYEAKKRSRVKQIIIQTALKISMVIIDYLNLKALKKRISYFISKGEILDVILKLRRKFIS